MTMECNWCERPNKNPITTGGGLRYCSQRCETRARRYAFIRMDAELSGDETPTREEYQDMWERAGRWTPEKMQDHIEELEQAAREYDGPLYEKQYTLISDARD